MKNMKSLLIMLLAFTTTSAWAQWNINGANINNTNTGNVGINNLSPGTFLDIRTNSNPQLYLSTSRTNSLSRNWGIGTNFSTEGDFAILASTTNANSPSLTRMVINGIGNVGIGTTNPQARLAVFGGVSFEGGRLYQSGDLPNDNNAQFYNNSATGYGLYSQGGGSGRYAFHFVNKDGASILYGRGDGNVGLGTYNPDAKLTVNGTVHAAEVKVDLNVPGPDYVFETEYNLLSLQEVETYITQNKHLPEVPSAKEMEQNGIKLSEMNMLLLKKVEELTLYLVQQDKINQEQAEKLSLLSIEFEKLLKR